MNNKNNFIKWLKAQKTSEININEVETEISDFSYNLDSISINSYNFFSICNLSEFNLYKEELLKNNNYIELANAIPSIASIITLYNQFISSIQPLKGKESFINLLSKSEKLYFIDKNTRLLKVSERNTQGSYNISKRIISYATKNHIFIESKEIDYPRKKDIGPFILNPNFKFVLGLGIKWLIGDENISTNPQFIISYNTSNTKTQIYRSVYRTLKNITQSNDYNWFIALYDRNINWDLLFTFDNDKKEFTLDILF